jgi:hypothetical protein
MTRHPELHHDTHIEKERMKMQLKIAFRGMRKSAAVESCIRDWAAQLDGVYGRIEHCDVVVEAPHLRHRQGNQYRVRVAMTVPAGRLVVSRDPGPDEAHQDLYVAVRDSLHTARRLLEDHVRRRLRREVKIHRDAAFGHRLAIAAEARAAD